MFSYGELPWVQSYIVALGAELSLLFSSVVFLIGSIVALGAELS